MKLCVGSEECSVKIASIICAVENSKKIKCKLKILVRNRHHYPPYWLAGSSNASSPLCQGTSLKFAFVLKLK